MVKRREELAEDTVRLLRTFQPGDKVRARESFWVGQQKIRRGELGVVKELRDPLFGVSRAVVKLDFDPFCAVVVPCSLLEPA